MGMAQDTLSVSQGTEHKFETQQSDEMEISLCHSSLSTSSEPVEEVSVWLDEKEEQQSKRQVLNDAFDSITGSRTSPLQYTLNTEWDDISATQQNYYLRKAREMIAATLSVVSPGQERELWESLRKEPLHNIEVDCSDDVPQWHSHGKQRGKSYHNLQAILANPSCKG
jgi:hypothetical protein